MPKIPERGSGIPFLAARRQTGVSWWVVGGIAERESGRVGEDTQAVLGRYRLELGRRKTDERDNPRVIIKSEEEVDETN